MTTISLVFILAFVYLVGACLTYTYIHRRVFWKYPRLYLNNNETDLGRALFAGVSWPIIYPIEATTSGNIWWYPPIPKQAKDYLKFKNSKPKINEKQQMINEALLTLNKTLIGADILHTKPDRDPQ